MLTILVNSTCVTPVKKSCFCQLLWPRRFYQQEFVNRFNHTPVESIWGKFLLAYGSVTFGWFVPIQGMMKESQRWKQWVAMKSL